MANRVKFNRTVVSLVVALALWLRAVNGFPVRMGTALRKSSVFKMMAGAYDVNTDANGVHTIKFQVAGKTMSFETGKVGRQASGAVMARTQDTIVYSTVCSEREPQPVDFTPLRVDWFARYSAVGQTIGAFHRRDSRGDDAEILVARLIDRPIRPMIADGWQHDTQILTWVMSYDKVHSPEALSICSASAAMCVSEVPMAKPVAGVEVGLVDGVLTVNPTKQQMANSSLQLTVAGTKEGILMIEGAADFLPESTMMEALKLGHAAVGEICDAIGAFQAHVGTAKKTDTLRKPPTDLLNAMDGLYGDRLAEALSIGDKHDRGRAVSLVEEEITRRFCTELPPAAAVAGPAAEDVDPDAPLVDIAGEDEVRHLCPAHCSVAKPLLRRVWVLGMPCPSLFRSIPPLLQAHPDDNVQPPLPSPPPPRPRPVCHRWWPWTSHRQGWTTSQRTRRRSSASRNCPNPPCPLLRRGGPRGATQGTTTTRSTSKSPGKSCWCGACAT